MNNNNIESRNGGLSPEEDQAIKDAESLEAYFKAKPEPVVSSLRESGPEIAEFENMIVLFESTYSLAELSSITDLTPEEALKHPVREPARIALNPIVAILHAIEKETNISPEKYQELKAKYKKLSRAVGIINKNMVDHTR